MCESEVLAYSTLGISLSSVRRKNLRNGAQLKTWGGGIVSVANVPPAATETARAGIAVTVCPQCRHSVRPAVLHTPCCPELRALLAPSPAKSFKCVLTFSSPCPRTPRLEAADELRRLADTARALAQSGWYRRGLDWQAARCLLRDAAPGAFIIRDSCDVRFIFSLSVQTERGPTSVRVHYEDGVFRLDCEPKLARFMPSFRCVVELVQHYVDGSRLSGDNTVWVDASGCAHAPVLLRAGLRATPPSLAHAARLAVHRTLAAADRLAPRLSTAPRYARLPLPRTLLQYLAQYPYSC